MRIIREELGEDSPSSEADEYSHQLESLKAGKETKDKLKKEIEPPVIPSIAIVNSSFQLSANIRL